MSRNSGGWGLRKTAFWAIVIIALMYLVAQIFRWIGAANLAHIADWVGWAAGVVSLLLVAVLAWDYVRPKESVWKVLYLIVLLIALVFIVLPRVI